MNDIRKPGGCSDVGTLVVVISFTALFYRLLFLFTPTHLSNLSGVLFRLMSLFSILYPSCSLIPRHDVLVMLLDTLCANTGIRQWLSSEIALVPLLYCLYLLRVLPNPPDLVSPFVTAIQSAVYRFEQSKVGSLGKNPRRKRTDRQVECLVGSSTIIDYLSAKVPRWTTSTHVCMTVSTTVIMARLVYPVYAKEPPRLHTNTVFLTPSSSQGI